MDRELLRNSVLRNNNYAMKIEDNYIIPTFLINESGEKEKLSDIRNYIDPYKENYISNLRKDIKNLKLSFQDCYKDLFRYILKFPIIIEDRSLWNKILDVKGININDPIRNLKILMLDLFFTKIDLYIDFSTNKNSTIYYEAKDRYLKIKYGLETIRYNNYGESNISRNIDRKYLEDYIKNFIKNNENYNNLQSLILPENTIIDNYLSDYQGAFNFINRLKSYLSDTFYLYDRLVITKKDVYNIDPDDFDINTNIRNENCYIDSISTVLKEVYKKDIYIHNTLEFSFKNIMWALKIIESNMFSWDIFIGKKIPYWIIKLFGYPPKEYHNKLILKNDKNDGGIDKFLEELKNTMA